MFQWYLYPSLTISFFLSSCVKDTFSLKTSEKCTICKNLVLSFLEGLNETCYRNYVGGNAEWEERNLIRFAYSESRFLEIIEHICKGDINCDTFLEENEDLLFDWYRNKGNSTLFEWLCVDKNEICCSVDRFGPNCDQCLMNDGKVCSGNGVCDGAGTREGTGKCLCSHNFKGELCSECQRGFYPKCDSDKLECLACHHTCAECTGGGASDCTECKKDYIRTFSGRCYWVGIFRLTMLGALVVLFFEVLIITRSCYWTYATISLTLLLIAIVYLYFM